MLWIDKFFFCESNSVTQSISITDPYYTSSSLNIINLDRLGFPINGTNAYFSFTLAITYDKPIEHVKLKWIFQKYLNLYYNYHTKRILVW